MKTTLRAGPAIALALFAFGGFGAFGACRSRSEGQGAPARAEFGVLFGGDIQDRTTIPLELDKTRQELGLRVTFAEPLEAETRVSWEIEKPTALRAPDGGARYAAELGERQAHPGERRVESSFAFRRGDPLGPWRVRIKVAERVVLDRRFEVVDPRTHDAGTP